MNAPTSPSCISPQSGKLCTSTIMTPTEPGVWKVYAEVYNQYGSFVGAVDNGCMEIKVLNPPNLGSKVDLGTNFYAYIINSHSGNVLTNDNDNVSCRTKQSTSNQQWKFKKKSDGSYEIESVSASGKHLDEYSGKGKQGDNVQVYAASSDETVQSWFIYSAGNGSYYFRPSCSNSAVLDVYDASMESGANVQIWAYNQSEAQKFKVEKIGNGKLTFSTKTVNLDLNGTKTATVKVTAEGILPSSWNFRSTKSNSSAMTTSWGTWSGNTNPLTITGNKTGTYTIKVALINSETDEEVYCENITVNISCTHSYGSWTTSKAASCTETGKKIRTCTVCGHTDEQVIPKTNHTYSTKTIAPTCTEKGYTLHTCICGESYKDNYTSAKGHSFGEWKVTKAATTTSTGLETRTCTRTGCGETETRTIPKLEVPTTDAKVVVETKNASAGGTVTIGVKLENNPGVSGMQLQLQYDSSVLTLQNAVAKDLDIVFSPDYTKNPYNIVWYSGVTNYTGNGTIAEFTFKVSDSAKERTDPYYVRIKCNTNGMLEEDSMVDVNETNVPFYSQSGGVIISSHIPGDINDDKKVNVKDLIRLQQYIAGWDVYVRTDAIDVNGDKKVNVKDLIRLQQYIAGWDVVVY